MWRSVGFLMSFAVVIEGMTIVAYIVMIAGGKQKREQGWKILCGLLFVVGVLQCAGMALIVGFARRFQRWGTTDEITGVALRQRRSLLPRLEARQLMDLVHDQLGGFHALRSRHHHGEIHVTIGRRI